ncbi:MAG: RHS repeat-associated core domain-containing protein, partial [Planctomycetota bacterium]
QSFFTNPYYFTGRRVDILDNGSLKIQYNRNRYYDYYTGRWLTQDPLGYADGRNLYEYAKGNPLTAFDPFGGRTWLADEPDFDIDWHFEDDWYERSTFDGMCVHFTTWTGDAVMGEFLTPFGIPPIGDPVRDLWEKAPKYLKDWARKIYSLTSLSAGLERWTVTGSFYVVDTEVGDCPASCPCTSSCCIYGPELSMYALDDVRYEIKKSYADEIVLKDKKTLVKDLYKAIFDIITSLGPKM